jgi:DNA-binding NarL/FixJ family response regulator
MHKVDTTPIRILIVDDHTLVRESLKILLENESDIRVVGETGGNTDALAIAIREQPDVILLDLDLGGENAIDLLHALRRAGGQRSKVLILTGIRNFEKHCEAVHCGAVGVVLKDQASQTLIKALRKVHAGEVWLDRAMIAKIFSESTHRGGQQIQDPEIAKINMLTKREREIATLIAAGFPTKRIATRLFISEKTVSNHLSAIYNKLNVTSRLELALYASRHQLQE